jgi:DNA-binding IclR family transcriptional regulator
VTSARTTSRRAPGREAPASTAPPDADAQREVIPRAQTRSLKRGLAALEYVALAGETGVSELASALQLPRASAHILLATLADSGYVRQTRRRGRYRLDLQVLALANTVLRQMPVRERAAPLLHQLASRTGMATYLAVLFRDHALNVDRIHPHPSPQARADLGQMNAAYASSMGKVLLAHLPADERDRYLATVRLTRLTDRTITSVDALRRELTEVAQRGYALSDGELRPRVRSVGAPIRSYEGEVVAAICALHDTPFGQPPDDTLVQAVTDTALQISHALGYGARTE